MCVGMAVFWCVCCSMLIVWLGLTSQGLLAHTLPEDIPHTCGQAQLMSESPVSSLTSGRRASGG